MRAYRLLVIGHHPPLPEWQCAGGVFGMLTFGITEAFLALPHVEVLRMHVVDCPTTPPPPVDAVLIISFHAEDARFADVKQRTGASCVASFRENPGGWDHSFAFTGAPAPGVTLIKMPCCKRLLVNRPKIPGSILVDHPWWTEDHTAEIEGWLRDYSAGPMSRLDHPRGEGHATPPWMTRLPYQKYPAYIESTNHFERHIVTHIEGYGYGIVDFALGGRRGDVGGVGDDRARA